MSAEVNPGVKSMTLLFLWCALVTFRVLPKLFAILREIDKGMYLWVGRADRDAGCIMQESTYRVTE